MLDPGQADLRVGVTGFQTRKMQSRSGMSGPGAPKCGSRLDDQRRKGSPVGRNAFDGLSLKSA